MCVMAIIKRATAILLSFWVLWGTETALAQAPLLGGFGGPTGFGEVVLSYGDDSPSFLVPLNTVFPRGLSFFGRTFFDAWVNINGNITMGAAYATFTPSVFPSSPYPMIAPWWADVDLRGPARNEIYSAWDLEGQRWIVTWLDVGYYANHVDKLNSFQMILTNRDDVFPGDFDVEFRYNRCQWTTGDITGVNGFGGSPAVAGFDAGNRLDYEVVPGSFTPAVLGLCTTSNVGEPGVWRFIVRSGLVILSVCGDNVLSEGEACDWGSHNSDTHPDFCRSDCQLPSCGDGVIDTGEVCDDGSHNSDTVSGACPTSCIQPFCGDGNVDPGESCDSGHANSNQPGSVCAINCTGPVDLPSAVTDEEPLPEAPDEINERPINPVFEPYWAERRIPILLNRRYVKALRHEITLYGGIIPNDPWFDYVPIGLRYDFFFTEALGIELDGAFSGDFLRLNSQLTDFFESEGQTTDHLNIHVWRSHIGVNFSPFYSKLSFLHHKLLHFDLFLFAGMGFVSLEGRGADGSSLGEEIRPEGSIGAGFNLFLSRDLSLRLDFRQFLFESTEGGVEHPVEFSLGLSLFL